MTHAMSLAHMLFGASTVYTGVNTSTSDGEEGDPSGKSPVQGLSKHVSFVSAYVVTERAFFVWVPLGSHVTPICPTATIADRKHHTRRKR